MKSTKKVLIFIATSLDGYIATADGDINWLSLAEKENEDYGYEDFIKSVDTVIMGRKTFEKVTSFEIEFPHLGKEVYVLSRQKRESIDYIRYYNGDIAELINRLKEQPGKNIYVDGGSDVIDQLLQNDLVDEFIISVVPILLGHGMPLFREDRPEMQIRHISTKTFETGVVQSHYKRIATKSV